MSRVSSEPHVLIRPIRPSDGPLLTEAMARLSPESVRRRFLSSKRGLTANEVRYLSRVDGVDHVALVAVDCDDPERIVGVARFVRLDEDSRNAEAAIVVADEVQRRGLGRKLLQRLADEARERGVERFTATMLLENEAARRLFHGVFASVSSQVGRGVRELVVDLEPAADLAA